MINIFLGIAIATAAMIITSCIVRIRIRRHVERCKQPKESIESYNATVFMDEKGRISWMDNSQGVQLIRRKRK